MSLAQLQPQLVMSFFGFNAILGHEGGTQKLRVRAQNKLYKLGLSCAKLSSSWLQAYSASD